MAIHYSSLSLPLSLAFPAIARHRISRSDDTTMHTRTTATSNERSSPTIPYRGNTAPREIPHRPLVIISRVPARSRTSLVNGRAVAPCRSADRAKRVSNDRRPCSFFSLSPSLPPPLSFSFSRLLFFISRAHAREATEFIARYTLRVCTRAARHCAARSSLIMNGLFIVADVYLACPALSTISLCAQPGARARAEIPFCRVEKERFVVYRRRCRASVRAPGEQPAPDASRTLPPPLRQPGCWTLVNFSRVNPLLPSHPLTLFNVVLPPRIRSP